MVRGSHIRHCLTTENSNWVIIILCCMHLIKNTTKLIIVSYYIFTVIRKFKFQMKL